MLSPDFISHYAPHSSRYQSLRYTHIGRVDCFLPVCDGLSLPLTQLTFDHYPPESHLHEISTVYVSADAPWGGNDSIYGFLIIDDHMMINDVTIYNDIFDYCGEDFFVYYNYNYNICPVYGIPPVVPSSMYMRENLNDVTEIVLPFNDVTSDVTDNDFHGGENPFSRAEGLMYPVSTLIYDFDPWPPPKRRSCFVLGLMDPASTSTFWHTFVSMTSLSWTATTIVVAALYLYLLIKASTTNKIDSVDDSTDLLRMLFLQINLLDIPNDHQGHGRTRANGRRGRRRHLSQLVPRRAVGSVCGNYANYDSSFNPRHLASEPEVVNDFSVPCVLASVRGPSAALGNFMGWGPPHSHCSFCPNADTDFDLSSRTREPLRRCLRTRISISPTSRMLGEWATRRR